MVGIKSGLELEELMTIAAHQYEVYIRATPEQVWSAITDPARTRQFFHGTSFDRPPVRASLLHLRRGTAARRRRRIEALDPPHRMVQTWHTLYDARVGPSRPAGWSGWSRPAGEGLTRLRVVHGDLAQSPQTWANVQQHELNQ